jgi:hypothetical protein
MPHFSRIAALAAVVLAVLTVGEYAVQAQSTRTVGAPRQSIGAGVTPPPLPFGDQTKTQSGARKSAGGGGGDELKAFARIPESQRRKSDIIPIRLKPPSVPKMSALLKGSARHTAAASGASITLTGTSAVAYLDDQTLAYGANVYWMCQNLKPSTTYRYIVFPPDGTSYIVKTSGAATFTTDTQGRCLTNAPYPYYAQITLTTPLGNQNTIVLANGTLPQRTGAVDAAYSGVWTIAVQNTATSQYEAIAYSVVLGTLNFSSFSDSGYSIKSNDFSSGSSIYVAANGLNPTHFYNFGFLNSSGNGIPCVYSIPGSSANATNGTCFVSGAGGILPTSQTLQGQYATPATGANAVGTQTIQLYDSTTNDLISTSQYSLNPSSVVWSSIIPYNGATNGTNLGNMFATDGILNNSATATPTIEQSVTGLTFAITGGLISGHSYRLTQSNANGVVMNSNTTDPTDTVGAPQAYATPVPFTASSANMAPTQVPFPINLTNLTAFGATQIPFAPNVYTMQLYDITAASVVGSKSFQIVSYSGLFQWTSPAAGSYETTTALGVPTNVTMTLTNNAGTLYGNWNGDGIKQVIVTQDSAAKVSLGTQLLTTTTTDSVGQTWNIVATGTTTLTFTPATAGQYLPVGATLPMPMTIASANGSCTTACVLRTSIVPLHGINPSSTDPTMTNRATNGLDVFSNGTTGSSTEATYTWAIGAYSVPATLTAPRYNQMMYRSGTNGAIAPGTYLATITVQNNGAARPMDDIQFRMPATFDPNTSTPTLVSATINGVNKTSTWKIYNQNGSNGATADNTLSSNSFGLQTTTNASTLPANDTAVFVINLPIPLTSFPFQEIAATANYHNVAGLTNPVNAYDVGPINTLTNAVAGTQNIDSTELGVFSLDSSLMQATVTPNVIPALATATTTFQLVNSTTGVDPNPDYIDQILLTVPTGAIPNSLTITSPNQTGVTWYANPTGTSGQWRIELCQPGPAPCSGTTDANALPPGDALQIKFNYTAAPTVGSYNIAWAARGANGNAVATATGSQIPILKVANTTANTSITFSGGYNPAPTYPITAGQGYTSVASGTEPTIGSWSNYLAGNGFVYSLYNNGSTPITDVAIYIPALNTSGQEFDAQDWNVQAGSVYVYGAGAQGAQCSGTGIASLTEPIGTTPGPATNGSIVLSGCNVPLGGTLNVFFNARSPYDTSGNPSFRFDASVADGAAPPAQASYNTQQAYSLSTNVRIVIDARLAIVVPTGGTYGSSLYGVGDAPSVSCLTCTYTNGLTPIVNFNNITGTVTANDGLAASVYSDSTNGWNLSVSADVNPSTSSGQLSTWVSTDSSVPGAGTYTKSISASPGTVVPTAGTLPLSTYAGSVAKTPIDNLMSFLVTVNPNSVNNNTTTTVTLTYTLIAN